MPNGGPLVTPEIVSLIQRTILDVVGPTTETWPILSLSTVWIAARKPIGRCATSAPAVTSFYFSLKRNLMKFRGAADSTLSHPQRHRDALEITAFYLKNIWSQITCRAGRQSRVHAAKWTKIKRTSSYEKERTEIFWKGSRKWNLRGCGRTDRTIRITRNENEWALVRSLHTLVSNIRRFIRDQSHVYQSTLIQAQTNHHYFASGSLLPLSTFLSFAVWPAWFGSAVLQYQRVYRISTKLERWKTKNQKREFSLLVVSAVALAVALLC